MNIPNEISQRRRYIAIGIFMVLISLLFILYLGQSLVGLTKHYQSYSGSEQPCLAVSQETTIGEELN